MKKIMTILLVFCVAMPSMAAQTIIWVTEGLDTANNTTAALPPDGITDDQGWVNMLTAAGHTVNVQSQTLRWSQISLEEDAMLKAADLIIVSRNGASGTYTGITGTNPDGTAGGATAYWNSLSTPLVCLNGNLITNATNRWNWFGAAMVKTSTGQAAPSINTGGEDPVLAFNDPVNQWELINSTGASTNADVLGVAAGGILLTTSASADGLAMVAMWDAGEFFVGSSGTNAGGIRLWFDASEYEKGGSPSAVNTLTGPYNLTDDGRAMFLDLIDGMMVPEPATVAMLSLGGLFLARRRR